MYYVRTKTAVYCLLTVKLSVGWKGPIQSLSSVRWSQSLRAEESQELLYVEAKRPKALLCLVPWQCHGTRTTRYCTETCTSITFIMTLPLLWVSWTGTDIDWSFSMCSFKSWARAFSTPLVNPCSRHHCLQKSHKSSIAKVEYCTSTQKDRKRSCALFHDSVMEQGKRDTVQKRALALRS